MYAVKRLHKYLYGRPFTIVTDHKPLEYIFKPSGTKASHANQRVIRWAVFMSSYDYTIKGRRTMEIPVADCLSRVDTGMHSEMFDVGTIESFYHPGRNVEQAVLDACEDNKGFSLLKHYVHQGWPRKLKNLNESLRAYYRVRDELTFHNELLYRGHRVVIPKPVRGKVLQSLHSAHQGVVKMKSLVRARYWWPAIDNDIEELCRTCEECSRVKRSTATASNADSGWLTNTGVFDRIHIDYAGPLEDKYLLVVVDAYSRFPFAVSTKGPSTAETIRALRGIFATFGVPKCIVADIATAFK